MDSHVARGAEILMRSKLFVPGSRPELFPKALAGEADGISFDLEDAVQESRKTDAREAVAGFLRSMPASSITKIIIVRVNGVATRHFEPDVRAIVGANVDMVNLAKPETPEDVRAAAAVISRIEQEQGITQRTGLLVNIESPRALRLAADMAAADPRVVGLQLGLGDLTEPIGIDRRDSAAVHHLQFAVRIAAGEAGVWAYDAAYAAVNDPDFYRHEAEASRRLGYLGKSCIHPTQIALANAAFRPTDDEIVHSLRVVSAWRDAEAKGIGALLVDGRMIDRPFARRAQAVVRAAHRLGLAAAPER